MQLCHFGVATSVGMCCFLAVAVAVARGVAVAVWQWDERIGRVIAVILSGDKCEKVSMRCPFVLNSYFGH